ncbi:hypothetical protein [Muribaculum intestinale]|uniref:Uncharacterized protein n=1 Tax=Muribaculum intestinale TaxID=1796646 RepID=A0A4S2FMP2_9BACT|nr:hypothetical protein [Muribaculum intestinale]MYM13441.1 hypothetical protein [Muribaculum intestinale]TGY70242.1 hypothetical protein E5333_12925 [Muribaculum intestinale]
MFELLLIIYLLPVVIVAALLLQLALFLLKKSIRIALWVIRKSALILKPLVVWLWNRTVRNRPLSQYP